MQTHLPASTCLLRVRDKSAGLLGGLPTYAAFPAQALVTDVVGQRVELAVSADDEDVVIGDRAEGF